MSTPTPSHPGQPSSAAKKPTGHVSTPSHLNYSSPAPPRSVPSPTAIRKDQAGKTPVNHPTTGSSSHSQSQGSKTLGGTPMVRQISRDGTTNTGASTASPSAGHLLSFGTPMAGLGLDLGTPSGAGQLGAGMTPAGLMMGGAPMNLSMSELGLTASASKRNEDEERKVRMRRVLHAIGRPKGRVSEEGIARVSRRVGFANDIDVEKLSNEERERRVGNRSFSIAGNTIVVDVALENHVPRSVQVMFNVEEGSLKELGERAGAVLLADLTPPDGLMLEAKLDRFAANLERLARLDKLSSERINCFAAIDGIYKSLKRLHEQELQAVKSLRAADMGRLEEKSEREVLCRKSGRPSINAHGKLGTVIEYWQDTATGGQQRRDADEMEIDGQEIRKSASSMDARGTHALRLEAESSAPELYPSLRVADSWLPDPLELPGEDSTDGLPWQDPPSTYLPSQSSQGGSMVADTAQQKMPSLRFTAKLEPPVVMPWQTASNLLSAVGMPQPPLVNAPYHHILLTPDTVFQPLQNTTKPMLSAEQSVLVVKSGNEMQVQHVYDLYAPKLEFAYKLEELPFSHPRQLIEALPSLRQWALTGVLLKSAFEGGHVSGIAASDDSTKELLSLMDLNELATNAKPGSLMVDVVLGTSPSPTFSFTFPRPVKAALARISVQIASNAEVVVGEQNLVSDDDEQGSKVKQIGQALEIAADVGVWIEWLLARFA